MSDSEPRSPSVKLAAATALESTQRLLTGAGRGARWRALVVLAAMAGLVGAGAAPPPLGLLQPVWVDPTLHHSVFDHGGVVAGLVFLALFLLFMGGFGRSFTLGFHHALLTGQPHPSSYRPYLRAGVAHFVWSSACSLPLYALLFGGEAVVAHDAIVQFTRQLASASSTDTELLTLALGAFLKFLLVLIPWTLLTLPLMVSLYELVPATMVLANLGPVEASRLVFRAAAQAPKAFAAYWGLRYLLQLAGNLAALLALAPCLLVSSPVVGPLVGGGWQLSRAWGGPGTPAGAAALTVGVLFAAIALYCTLCAALLPVSVFLNGIALQLMKQCWPSARDISPVAR